MVEVQEMIATIEAMEQQRIEAVNEANDLKIKVWKLEQELAKQKEETERWKKFVQK